MNDRADDLRATYKRVSRGLLADVAPELAENDGWPQRAMPAMLAELGLTEGAA